MAVRRKLPLRAVGRLAYRAGRRASREDVEDSDSPGSPFCANRAPGDGFVAMAARRKPPARRRSFGISRRMMRIGGRCKDSDSPGNPSARTHPGEGFMAMAAHRKPPLRAVGRLAYHAGRCASRENGNDSDPSGNPSLHEPRPRGRFRGGGNSSERPPARRRSLGISRRMAVSQQRRLPRERFVGKEASGACFPGDENRSYCAQGTDGWAFIPRQDSPLGWVALQPRAAAYPSASRRFSRHTSRICPRPLKSQGTTSASR